MRKVLIILICIFGLQISAKNPNTSKIDVMEVEENPMRPDFSGNLKKRPIKKIKEKNKIIEKNLLNSNKLLYKKNSRRNYEKRS